MDDKKLKVGILGTGEMAGVMAASIAEMEHAEVWAVASRTMEDACTFALKYDIKKAYGTYEELLKDKEVELVYIAVPQSHHALYASQCIDKKKPVLLEKSFTVNAEQAEALIAKAEHEGVFITEAVTIRYMPMAKKIKEIVESGIIGKINTITANLGYAMTEKQRILDPALAGGALLELGVYPLTLITLIAGTGVTDISCEARKSKSGIDLEDHVFLVVKEGTDEIRCAFYTSVIGPADQSGIVYGTQGYMVIGNIENLSYVEVYDKDHKRVERIEQSENRYMYEIEACRRAIGNGKIECEEMTHKESIRIMKIMDLIRRGVGVSYPFE